MCGEKFFFSKYLFLTPFSKSLPTTSTQIPPPLPPHPPNPNNLTSSSHQPHPFHQLKISQPHLSHSHFPYHDLPYHLTCKRGKMKSIPRVYLPLSHAHFRAPFVHTAPPTRLMVKGKNEMYSESLLTASSCSPPRAAHIHLTHGAREREKKNEMYSKSLLTSLLSSLDRAHLVQAHGVAVGRELGGKN